MTDYSHHIIAYLLWRFMKGPPMNYLALTITLVAISIAGTILICLVIPKDN